MTLDASNFCLMTPMTEHKHLRVNLSNMPNEIIKELNVHAIVHNG